VGRLALLVVFVLASCQHGDPPARRSVAAPLAPPPRPAVHPLAAATTRLHALLLNGGGSKPQNFQSHLLHVEQLFGVLERAGVDRSRISVFSADGDDPEPDVALRDDAAPEDFWLLDGTRLEMALRPPVEYVDTRLGDVPVRAATKANLAAWFADEGRRLGPGDVLLLYVTDHGTKNADDMANNRIVLWGKDESLSVQELAVLLAELDPGVHVVTVMSQCYSGAFAGLAAASAGSDRPPGNVCGYYSSTADRQAYGCYAENRGRENVGHSFHFIEALATTGRLDAAHDDVLVADATPDVPLRSSDVYLQDLLGRIAEAEHRELADVVDALLAEAWRDRKAWEPDIRRLDRIAAAFGVFSPRSLHELDEQSQRIDAMVEQLKTHGRAWQQAKESAARANLDRFVAAHAEWTDRLADGALVGKPRADLDALRADVLAALETSLLADDATDTRLTTLRDNAERAKAIGYRMEVRQGVVLRMRALLLSIAGRVYLADRGGSAERDTYAALRACEALAIPPTPLPPGTELVRAEPFPALADDVELASSVLPAWLGIQFRQAKDAQRAKHGLTEGASTVMMVYDDSPAARAGIHEGDVILGPPGAPFVEKDQVREWVMRSSPDVPATLELLRDGAVQTVSLTPSPMPQKWPSLPGPPKVGSTAPALRLEGYRGTPPTTLADGRPHLLFFWATWCGICKTAVPELLAFEAARHTQVVAITDETATELDPFFAEWKGAFPALVVSDETRGAFRSYGVGGTPSFVLVGGDGVVQAHATGYAKKKGLQIDGWAWKARPAGESETAGGDSP
jgi:thiol-disulfide isomerase/thioredoxin